jgi:TPR repeat protein
MLKSLRYIAKALVNGDGVAQDFVLAAEWYEKAAAQGCVESRHRLGEMYYVGKEGVEQDFARAVVEFRRAAEEEGEEGGHAPAQSCLAFCYYRGDRVEKDHVQARARYKKAALGEDSEAALEAALMCYKGEGGDPDFEYAERIFRKAAKNGDGRVSKPARQHVSQRARVGAG